MRSDDGVCSEWFEIAQGPCQGSVISPLLFNISSLLYSSSQFRDSARIRTYSQILPIFKSICLRLALKRHWNVHDVQFGKWCMVTTLASCRGHRAAWSRLWRSSARSSAY